MPELGVFRLVNLVARVFPLNHCWIKVSERTIKEKTKAFWFVFQFLIDEVDVTSVVIRVLQLERISFMQYSFQQEIFDLSLLATVPHEPLETVVSQHHMSVFSRKFYLQEIQIL